MSRIEHLGDPVQHFWLTRSVARSLGLSFSEAMAEGHISQSEYAALVTRCRRCPHVAACQDWLGNEGLSASAAPGFCANAGVLDRLRDAAKRRSRGRAI
ncbi:DUF6455 family protein [Shimia biformata]|uniref:DUF6455 family protein n=1 Tax=Shimia biformata TaxID=1294299 RepID=UPI0019526A7C|nr:DUF6455 family protein [Shimia biformata]